MYHMYCLALEGLGGSSIIQREILQPLRIGMRGVGHITMGGIYVSLGLVFTPYKIRNGCLSRHNNFVE